MRAFLRRLLERTAQKVNRSAAGTAVPAGIDSREPRGPTARERTLMRRRLRALKRRREALAGEAGDAGARERVELEREQHALEEALERRKTLDELLASGLSARCPGCGELAGRRERHCETCGAALPEPRQPEQHGAPRVPHPTGSPPVVRGASSGRSPTPPAR